VRTAHVVVAQQELAQLRAVPGRLRANRGTLEARWRWRGVRVERCLLNRAAARPEAATDHFMRVRLARDAVGLRPLRRSPAREARHRQVEAAPEKVDRAALA